MSVQVAVGLIFNKQNQILIASRKNQANTQPLPLWEFPGGKIEANENPYQALCRELKEEINISVINARPFSKIQQSDTPQHHPITLHFFSVTTWAGHLTAQEKQQLRWVLLIALPWFAFPAANQPIIDQLSVISQAVSKHAGVLKRTTL